MLDLKVASLRAHGNNIGRYRWLLGTCLSDLERRFIERRLQEEVAATEGLGATKFPITLPSSNSMPEAPPSKLQFL